jgi:hypothetical protein
MSDEEVAGNVRVVTVGEPGEGAAGSSVICTIDGCNVHVIGLRGADGWELSHPAECPVPADCAFTEAAGRVSRAFCATGGRWTVDVSGGGLVLLERLGG